MKPHDQFAKNYLEELLSPLGRVEISKEITDDTHTNNPIQQLQSPKLDERPCTPEMNILEPQLTNSKSCFSCLLDKLDLELVNCGSKIFISGVHGLSSSFGDCNCCIGLLVWVS